jgi:(p)ppGpp synthase/HD superfamily hydrolase
LIGKNFFVDLQKRLFMELTSKQLEEAIKFAAEKHSGQTRKGDGRPYILHPMSVLSRLNQVKKSSNPFLLMAVCMLHDTVEDCGVSLQEIADKFGYQVASLVEELTLDKTKYETIGKKEYLAQHCLKMSSYALAIKLADRLDNVSDMKSMSAEFRGKYRDETNYILRALLKREITKTHLKLIRSIDDILHLGLNLSDYKIKQ